MALRKAVRTVGKARLGFDLADVGTHSTRSGAAMTIYLNKQPICTIMLLGRWSSDAFITYIRRQVQDFSTGVSDSMIMNEETYMTPDLDPMDPRIRNHPNNAGLRNNAAPTAPFKNRMPAFALFT